MRTRARNPPKSDDALSLMAPTVKVREDGGSFAVEVEGATLRFAGKDVGRLDELLDALTSIRRDLAGGDDFVPSKPLASIGMDGDEAEVAIRFLPEHLEILRDRVRVGREENLDAAVQRAVRTYLASLLTEGASDAVAWRGQSRLPGADGEGPRPARALKDPASPWGLGPVQMGLLRRAVERGHLTLLDVGKAYGLSPRKGRAAGARAKADAAMGKLVDRGLLRFEARGADRVWVPTETGRLVVEESEGNDG